MGIFAVPSAMRAKRCSVTTLKVKGEKRRFIREAEDLVVFSPNFYKYFHAFVVYYPSSVVQKVASYYYQPPLLSGHTSPGGRSPLDPQEEHVENS